MPIYQGSCRADFDTDDVELAAGSLGQIQVAKLDIDESQEWAAHYRIQSVPTLVLFRDGKEVARSSGYQTLPQLRGFVDKALAA